MTDKIDQPPVVDFASRRRERLHLVHEARLEKMRGEFEKAFPLLGKRAVKSTGPTKKKKKPRKS